MEDNKFSEIINFAIEREYEAAEFYMELQGKVKFDNSKHFLKELENMERAHAAILQNFIKEDSIKISDEKVPDLKISNYLVGVEPNKEMSFQEILIIAIKREEAANQMYLDFSNQSIDMPSKAVFLKLATEEAKHKLILETIYDDEVLKEN
jgi:rubrerythrin